MSNFSPLSENSLKESLEAALHSQKKLEEELSTLKDEFVDTYDQYFEQAHERVTFLYPDLDLIQMDLFKVVRCDLLLEE